MEQLLQQVNNYKEEINAFEANTPETVEAFRIKYLGTKGLVKTIMGLMKDVPVENKKEAGQLLNEFKLFVEEKFETSKAAIENNDQATSNIDWSLPGDAVPVGSRHPLSLVRNKIVSIFQRLGFAIAEGPEIEDDFHNFGALNIPDHHPARAMHDMGYLQVQSIAGGFDAWVAAGKPVAAPASPSFD